MVRSFARMGLIRIENHNLTRWRDMNGTPAREGFGAIFYDSECCTFVCMSCKRIGYVPCMEQFDVTEIICAPNFGALALVEDVVVTFHECWSSPS
jgi:hypothetical protein